MLFDRLHARAVMLALFALLLVNCRASSGTTGPEISLNFGFDPPTIDPALATDPPTMQVDNLLFLNLVGLDESGGVPSPALASQWLVSSDGLVWEFRLRDDAYWVRYDTATLKADKLRAVDAADVVYSVRRLFDPRTQSTFAHLFAPLIRNAGALNQADPRTAPKDLAAFASRIGVVEKDPRTVQFILTRPLSAFPALAAVWLGRVQPHEPIESDGINWTDPGTIWTSGPYMLESWDHNQSIVLRRNPYYYDAANVQIERLNFRMIPDVTSALDAYLHGDLDTTDPYDSIEGDMLGRVQEDTTLTKDLKTLPGLCTQYIGFDTRQAPFDNPAVRRAFAAGLNRDDIVSSVLKEGVPALWFTPPQLTAAPDISATLGIPFDAPGAKVMLDKSAWGGGKRLPLVTFEVNSLDVFIQMAVSASESWKAALGASVQVVSDDWDTYLQKLAGKDAPAIFRMGYCASYPDAGNFLYDVFHSGSPFNFTHWSSAEFDRLVEQAARETDSLKRRALYTTAEKILVQDQAVIIPVMWTTRVALTNPHVNRTYTLVQGFEHVEKWTVSP